MNRKLIIGVAVSAVAIGAIALVPLAANAQSTQNQVRNSGEYGTGAGGMEIKAQAMDMTSEQLKEKLQTKTMPEVISDQGITTEQYHEKVQTAAQKHWQEMGLNQEEIQQRTQDQQQRQADCDSTGEKQGLGVHRNDQSQ